MADASCERGQVGNVDVFSVDRGRQLSAAENQRAMAYFFDHQSEIDGEIKEEQRPIEEARKSAKPTPVELRL